MSRQEQSGAFPPPVFILGSPRSFTSIACSMIGQHRQAYGVPELNLLGFDQLQQMVEQFSGRRAAQMHGLLRTVAQLYAGEQSFDGIDLAHRWILTRLQQPAAEVYRELCRRIAPRQVVDKSPLYSSTPDNLARLAREFPEAYYLHLVRHPVAQGRSMLETGAGIFAVMAGSIDFSVEPPVVDPQISWYEIQHGVSEFLRTIPAERTLRLRGEDLLADPENVLPGVCRWLGWSQDPASIEAMLHPERSPFAGLGPVGAHLGNDMNFLKRPALRRGRPAVPSLDGPLPWRKDGRGLYPPVIRLAQELGYA